MLWTIFNKLQTSIDFDFMWPYMKAMDQNGELEKIPAMRFQQLLQDFSIKTHQYSLKWTRIYQKYFHRLFKKHPKALKLIRERFDIPEGGLFWFLSFYRFHFNLQSVLNYITQIIQNMVKFFVKWKFETIL